MCIYNRRLCTACLTHLTTDAHRRCSTLSIFAARCSTSQVNDLWISSDECPWCTPQDLSRYSRDEVLDIAETLLEGVPRSSFESDSDEAEQNDGMWTEFAQSPVCGPEGLERRRLLMELAAEIGKGETSTVGGIPTEQLEAAYDASSDCDADGEESIKVQYESGSEEGEIREVRTVPSMVKKAQDTLREMTHDLNAAIEADVDNNDEELQWKEFEQCLDDILLEEQRKQLLWDEFEQSLDEMLIEEQQKQLRWEAEDKEEKHRELEKICAETVEEINRSMTEQKAGVAKRKVGTAMYWGGELNPQGPAAKKQRRESRDLPLRLQEMKVY